MQKWLSILTIPLLIAWVAPVGANPIPSALIFTHVQAVDGLGWPNITTCEQIVQYSEATGAVEFVLYLRPFDSEPLFLVTHFEATLTWDEDWEWVDYEFPGVANGSVVVSGNEATVSVDYIPAWPDTDEIHPLMRCLLNVDSAGKFDLVSGFAMVTAGCWGYDPIEVYMVEATAGVVCDYCYRDCDYGRVCGVEAQSPLLNLQLVAGTSTMRTLLFEVDHEPALPPCPFEVLVTEPWLSVSASQFNDTTWEVGLAVDATDLSLGEYLGWVRGEGDCVGCTQVNLEVLETTATASKSLSAVKWLY